LGDVGAEAEPGRGHVARGMAQPGAAESLTGALFDRLDPGGLPGPGVHPPVLGDGAAAAGRLVLANCAPRSTEPEPGAAASARSAQLVVDRAGDGHAEVELLPGPAGSESLLIFDELLGGRPVSVDEAVAHDPVGVVLIHHHQVDP